VQRYDIGTLQPAKRLANGTVVAEAHLTRTGVFKYANKDGTVRSEYRPDSEVFKPESLDSFKLVPVTDDHPPEMLTAANARQYSVGSTGETIRRDENHVIGSVAVYDARTISKMAAGKLQVSCGYECDLDETPGTAPDGTHYDAVQRNIRGNHLAIVQRGRADSARIRMDASMQLESVEQKETDMTLEKALADLADAHKEIGAQKARADAADKAHTDAKAQTERFIAQLESTKEELAIEKKARTDAATAAPMAVRARVDLETKAGPVMGKDFKMDDLDDRAIRVAVIKKITKVDVGADKSNDYVTARFDAAIERVVASTDTFQAANKIISNNRADQAFTDEAAKARAEMVAHNRSQHVAK